MSSSESDEDFHPRIRNEFPYDVQKFPQVTIVLEDNIKLAATLWIPTSFISSFHFHFH